jgi:hypothetical protein
LSDEGYLSDEAAAAAAGLADGADEPESDLGDEPFDPPEALLSAETLSPPDFLSPSDPLDEAPSPPESAVETALFLSRLSVL